MAESKIQLSGLKNNNEKSINLQTIDSLKNILNLANLTKIYHRTIRIIKNTPSLDKNLEIYFTLITRSKMYLSSVS